MICNDVRKKIVKVNNNNKNIDRVPQGLSVGPLSVMFCINEPLV